MDAKVNAEISATMVALTKCLPNVYLASRIERVVYGGFSRLQADINCMKDHLNSSVKWKYLLNIAGQSFPLKTNSEIVQILRLYNGSNDIEGMSYEFSNRISHEWREIGLYSDSPHVIQTGKLLHRPPHNLTLIKGSAYGIFSYQFVDYIVNNPIAKDLLEWSKHTYSPDEHFWATLHHTHSNPQIKPPGSYAGTLYNYIVYNNKHIISFSSYMSLNCKVNNLCHKFIYSNKLHQYTRSNIKKTLALI